MDLTQILQAGLSSIGGGSPQNVVKQVADITKQATAEEALATSKILQQQAIVENQKIKGELEAQQNARTVATSLGTNGSDSSNILGFLSQRMREAAIAASESAAEVTELESNNDLFSNPLGFARDLVYGDGIRNRAAATAQEFQTNAAVLSGLNSATQQTAATQNAIAETLTDATLEASQRIQAENQNLLAAQTKSKLAGIDLDMTLRINQLNAQQVSQANEAKRLRMAEEQQAWMREQKRLSAEEDQSLLDYYNAGAKQFGQPVVNSIKSLNTLRQLNKGRTDYVIMRGAEMTNPELGGVRYGSNPLEALQAIQTFNVPLPSTQQQVAKKLSGASATLNSDALALMGVAKNPLEANQMLADKKQLPQLQQNWLEFQARQMLGSVNPADQSNIYALPSLDILKDKTYLNQNKFAATYIAPSVAAGGAQFDPASLLKVGADAVIKGETTTSEVVDAITWTANQLKATNNAVNNYRGFGLPDMESVNMPVVVGSGGLHARTQLGNIDVTDSTSINRALLQVINDQRTESAIYRGSTPGIVNWLFGQ